MTNRYVTIRAHYEEKYAARELIYTRRRHVRFAHYFTERPVAQRHRRHEERYSY